MKRSAPLKVATAILLMSALQPALATTITFDEYSANNSNSALSSLYAPLGVTFGGSNSGIWDGLSAGDIGNWALEGSNGSAFLGNNGFNNGGSYVTSIYFETLMSNVSFDVSRSNGSAAGQSLIASAYNGSDLLSSQTILLGAVNSWTSIAFGYGSISSLIITGSTTGFSPFGLDNLQFNNTVLGGLDLGDNNVTAIPEPETYALMLAGLGLLGVVARRRRSQPPVSA
ncbi:MAG: PEP-CTERM sorting domain-containing protein [Burkholderiales bacterium]|nr:PEP-CTERM sorting domain-containing protein [Burkholderiales bacterium]MDP2398578.1 PEP-CTERM sorting domain-containing protein [Burkholderiales bacterium]